MNSPIQILLTNDDGIESPGLWAAAEGLSELGYVHVVAPRQQSSGMGRSLPISSDGIIEPRQLTVHGKEWTVYAVGGTPAQAVLHGALEVMPRLPDLVVSGINYGENLSTGVSASGTVGAAIEAAALEIPALAISLQTASQFYLSYSREIDFNAARYFCTYFGRLLLQKHLPEDVNALKVDVPANATPATPWQITRLAQHRYYQPHKPERTDWLQPGQIGFSLSTEVGSQPQDTDLYTLLIKQVVSVTPLSLDFTSRVSFTDLDQLLRDGA